MSQLASAYPKLVYLQCFRYRCFVGIEGLMARVIVERLQVRIRMSECAIRAARQFTLSPIPATGTLLIWYATPKVTMTRAVALFALCALLPLVAGQATLSPALRNSSTLPLAGYSITIDPWTNH